MLDFTADIYRDHLEEASSLYEQRLSRMDSLEGSWLALQDLEERMEPHVDALMAGEDLALGPCRMQASGGEAGELHAAVRVFCRQNRMDLLREVLRGLDPAQGERMKAVIDAVKDELPVGWDHEVIQMLSGEERKLVLIAAEVAGYRRLPAGSGLLRGLEGNDPETAPILIWALGRLRERNASAWLSDHFAAKEDESVCFFSALALLRMGEPQILDQCSRLATTQNWPTLLLGLGGDRSTVPFLLENSSQDEEGLNGSLALGLLGDISAIEPLLSHLVDPKMAESSALALNLITGAEIYEEVFIPEEIDEDELFEEEREKFKQGQVPTRLDGKPFGITITRLSQNSDEWHKWWSKNRSLFKHDVRYRNSRPYSPACLLENLESEKSPRRIRKLAYEELVIRYGVDFPFETDMPVAQQKKVLGDIAKWVQASIGRFREGAWYFAGQLMS